MTAVEIVVAVIFAGLGVRSLVHWLRRPYESTKAADLALYALFVTGRVGMWAVLSLTFALYALTPTRGRAFIDDVSRFQWLSMVFLVLGAVQLVAAYFLRQRTNGR